MKGVEGGGGLLRAQFTFILIFYIKLWFQFIISHEVIENYQV